MNITFYRIIDHRNSGDMLASPKPFFSEFADCQEIDMRHWTPDKGVSVFGGGGILYHELHDILHAAAQARKAGKTGPIIIWGAGENMTNQSCLLNPDYLKDFDLSGLRDGLHGTASHLVPCASCMLPQLQAGEMTPVFEVVIYDHFGSPIPWGNIAPRLTNHEGVSIQERMNFIASGKIVVTNSYHGAYWAMLMGRRVALVTGPPNASRYHHFPYQPVVIDSPAQIELANRPQPDDYLADCRQINRDFFFQVMGFVK